MRSIEAEVGIGPSPYGPVPAQEFGSAISAVVAALPGGREKVTRTTKCGLPYSAARAALRLWR